MKFYKARYNETDWYEANTVDREISFLEALVKKLTSQFGESQDKLTRRNMQIRELKKEIKKLREGNSVVENIIENHPATVFECVHNVFIEHYPKTAPEHQAISHYCNKIQELLI